LLDELDRTQASLIEGDGKPDFNGAAKQVAFVESAAAIQPEHQACLTLIDAAAAKVKAALALKPANAAEIQLAFDTAKDQARKGAASHDFSSLAACKKTLATVTALTVKAHEDHTTNLANSGGDQAGAATAWIAARKSYETLFKVLSNHKRKGDATFVAGLVSPLETDFEAARKKAEEQFKYAEVYERQHLPNDVALIGNAR